MTPRRILGLMSGTSLDGVDCALCTCSGRRQIELIRLWSVEFPRALARRLHAAAQGEATSWEAGQLHHDLGRFYVRAAQSGLGNDALFAVGLHGQTVFHHPDRRTPATFQLGESAHLVEALRVPVVSNFRAADLAAGGQGAPLATLFHRVAFAQRGRYVAVNNLGGISNVTALDWTQRTPEPRVLAFDTGPANVLLDLAVREFSGGRHSLDLNGRWAGKGWIAGDLVESWLKHPYFRQAPPKSTGRELFGEPFWKTIRSRLKARRLSREDVLATLTWLTARSIAISYDRFLRNAAGELPQTVILAGGGAANPVLKEQLDAALAEYSPAVHLTTVEELGWPRQAIEPAAFALLAHYRCQRWPANLPETTGANRAVLLGQLAEP